MLGQATAGGPYVGVTSIAVMKWTPELGQNARLSIFIQTRQPISGFDTLVAEAG